MKKIVTALVLGTFLIGCGGSDGDSSSSGSQGDSYAFDKDNTDTKNSTQKESTKTVNKSIKEILKTKELDQNQYYKTAYNCQGNMLKCIKRFKVKDSIGKICSFHTLDSTSASNPYTTEPYSQSRGTADDGRTTFTIMWQYGATEGSHIDFYVTCKDQEDLQKNKISLAKKYELDIPTHTKESFSDDMGNLYFFKSISLDDKEDIHTTKYKTLTWDFTDSKWAGLSAKANDKLILNMDSTSGINFEDINEVLFSHDTINHTITVDVKDKDSNILKTNTINDIEDGEIEGLLFMGDIKNTNANTLLYYKETHLLTH